MKSTARTESAFEWSRREFEKAIEKRGRWEIWRVYGAGTMRPVARRLRNPIALLERSKLRVAISCYRVSLSATTDEEVVILPGSQLNSV